MRRPMLAFAVSLILAIGSLVTGGAAIAQQAPKGLWLVTDYPAVTVRAGETASIRMKLQNAGLPPERAALSVQGLPSGWKAQIMGGGQPVEAAMPFTNDSVSLELRLDIPAEQKSGTFSLGVQARGSNASATLPIQVTLGQELPAKLTLKPKLPSLKGTVRASFDYEFSVKNDSGKNLLINLGAEAPPNFQASFTENYGTQEINSIPVDAGQSKDLKLKVQLPPDASAGNYQILLTASAEGATAQVPLALEATGQSKLRISGKDERLSGSADAGETSQIHLILSNDGTAPAEKIDLSASPPTDWKVDFADKTIPELAPGQKQEIVANVTPSAKAIAGDYMTTFKASASGDTASADYRVGVTTSTVWGAFGIGIIAIALLVLVGAVARFGRR